MWDSGSDFEREQCKAYPWAHNTIQDEEFSPQTGPGNDLYASLDPSDDLAETIAEMNDPDADGCEDGGDGNPGACPLGETVDERSLKDGAGPEAVVVGHACGRTLVVTATEKQGTAFVYDATVPTAPTLLFVHHLSPDSEKKNPGVAYADGTLGDIDPESSIFLTAAKSPTGKAGVMFGGAWSGTISFYEFEGCVGDETDDAAVRTKDCVGWECVVKMKSECEGFNCMYRGEFSGSSILSPAILVAAIVLAAVHTNTKA
eukprot:gnl/TRDRNA2_/TRDRNA2_174763_c3_seq10.p1 gnl/TRDRNA2_/TRDRNA2_174763_c3~~gnl/TRDRNA2_/TRDRNA2_174763_c3_seq10.p1  ORF type:complete len:275 (+),score=53.62 gnl/TRDRNA2_/TRDRNA2_174763_c3_seq10:49-825(+)